MEGLVKSLVQGGHLRSPRIIEAMKTVDRAMFLPEEVGRQAYVDYPIKFGTAHHSAPHMYAVVLEELGLAPGDTFLAVGSGTGFLCTIAGLLLASPNVADDDGSCIHGIEIAEANVQLANDALDRWLASHHDRPFVRPQFRQGNAFCLDAKRSRLYSKIYIGAGATDVECRFFLQFLDRHGVLVGPVGHELRTITRNYDGEDSRRLFGGIAFAPLASRPTDDTDTFSMALRQPESLQKLARNFIRRDLLGPDCEALIHSLPLPEALKLYINFGFHYELPDEMLPPEPQQSWSLNQLVEATSQLLALACDNIALGKPKRAKANLNKAESYLESPLAKAFGAGVLVDMLGDTLVRRAECTLSQGTQEDQRATAIADCTRVVDDKRFSNRAKVEALMMRAKARAKLEESIEDLEAAADLDASNETVQSDLGAARRKLERQQLESEFFLHIMQLMGETPDENEANAGPVELLQGLIPTGYYSGEDSADDTDESDDADMSGLENTAEHADEHGLAEPEHSAGASGVEGKGDS